MAKLIIPDTISFRAQVSEDDLRKRMGDEVLEQIGGLDPDGKRHPGIKVTVNRGSHGGLHDRRFRPGAGAHHASEERRMTHVISIDYRSMLYVDGEPTGQHLTRQEAVFLRAILAHERVANREYLLSVVYGGRDEPEIKIIDVFITKLRAKLGPHRSAIETVWGRGYCRNPDYQLAPEPDGVPVGVDAKLIEEIIMVSGGTPEDVVARLVKAEHDRLWSAEAA